MAEGDGRTTSFEIKEPSEKAEHEHRRQSHHDQDEIKLEIPAPSSQKRSSAQKRIEGKSYSSKKSLIRRVPFLLLAALVLVVTAISGYAWWTVSRKYEVTDDAFIQARFFIIAPKVSGYIANVPVTDNQFVDASATLAVIDDRDYRTALALAEAQLAEASASIPNVDAQIAAQEAQIAQAEAQIVDAEAALKFAQQQNGRAQELAKTGSGTVQRAQQTQSQLLQAQAGADRARAGLTAAQKQLAALQAQRQSFQTSIMQARARFHQAELNVAYTVVKADQQGHVTQLTAAKGQFVQFGQSLMVFVPDLLWVVANYRETQISDMRPGQFVDIRVDAYPKLIFKGHVDSIQSGSGTAFSLLPSENATGNYVKVVQRVPVKIVIDENPHVVLGPGMSVVSWVRVR